MTDKSPAPSKIIPNTFQTPNLLTDEGLLALLNGSETKCYLVVIRKTFGWRKERDRIAKSQIMAATGLSESAVDQSMASLVAFGLILRTAENNPANEGVEWAPQMDDSQIDMQALIERQDKAKQANVKKTAKARSKRGGGVVQHTHLVQQPQGGVVQHTPQQPITTNDLVVVKAGDIAKKYEQEFGGLTPMIADMIQDDCQTYPVDWIPEAMQIAVEANKRDWRYVRGILKRCAEKNLRPSLNKLEKPNGNTRPNQKSKPAYASHTTRRAGSKPENSRPGDDGPELQPADDPQAAQRHRERWQDLRQRAKVPAV